MASQRCSQLMACCGLSSVNGLRGLVPPFPPPRSCAEARQGLPLRFPLVHSKNMTAIPSSRSARASHNYDLRAAWAPLLGTAPVAVLSTLGKPSPTGLPKANPGPWWVSVFFGKSTLLFMATVLESPEFLETPQASSSNITCDLAQEATRKHPGGQPSKANASPNLSGHHEPADFQGLGPFEPLTPPLLLYSFPPSSPHP